MADESRKLAALLLGNAVGSYLVAKSIIERPGSTFPYPPFFENIGYVLELAMKAYVLDHGGTPGECKHALRHDLRKAARRVCELGLGQMSQDTATLIDQIGLYHRDRSFRYLTDIDVADLPDAQGALDVVERFLRTVLAQLPGLLSSDSNSR